MAGNLMGPNAGRLPALLSRSFANLKFSKWIIFPILFSFVAGFGTAAFFRGTGNSLLDTPNLSDYEIDLPQGQIVVSITDPRVEPAEISRLTVERHGDVINGVPQTVKYLPAREPLNADDLIYFRQQLKGVFSPRDSDWQKANKIREWLSALSKCAGGGIVSRNARTEYEQMRSGVSVLCGNVTDIYVALCEAAGLTARGLGLSILVRDGRPRADSHAAAEVWIPEFGGWVYQDPTFNCYWEVSGRPASAIALHMALMRGEPLQFQPKKASATTRLTNYYVDPRLFFRHLSYEYRVGGPLLYFADEHLEPFNMEDHNWAQSDSSRDFERADLSGLQITDKRGEVAPGIFAQLIGHKLFIRDRRPQDRGIRVRVSQGTVRGCAYEHQRAEAMKIFDSNNFVRNGLFRSTSLTSNVAIGWNVSGDVYGLTVFGGQGMGSDVSGSLWQPVSVPVGRSYLLYARLSVTRGVVTWSLSDSETGKVSDGRVEPGRMREILSDVVPSESGKLKVAFSLPTGGAFRVIDVIVTEAPRLPVTSDEVVSDSAVVEQ